MTILFDYERLLLVPAAGEARTARLEDLSARVGALAGQVGVDPGSISPRISHGASLIRIVVASLRSAITTLQQMIEQAGRDRWQAGTFASFEAFVVACAAAVGLFDRTQLDPQLRDILAKVDAIGADREWIESLPVAERRRWFALFCLRWLPDVNAVGAFNCIDGVLKGFQEIKAISPNSFASLVDAEILSAITRGLDETLHPDEFYPRTKASDKWRQFFEHQQRLGRKNRRWDDQSWRSWAEAEQEATQLGYQWAIERNARPRDDVANMTLLSEVYRWVNRQHGLNSDPIRLIAPLGVLPTGTSADVARSQMYHLFDPHNHDFTYQGVRAVHELTKAGVLVVPTDPEQLAKALRLIPVLDPWGHLIGWPPFPPAHLRGGVIATGSPELPSTASAAEIADLARVERRALDELRKPIAAANRGRDSACNLVFDLLPECK